MTGQVCDQLRYRARTWLIQGAPLEPYLERHPDRRPRSNVFSTALYRGYLADWLIDRGRLFLAGLSINVVRRRPGAERSESTARSYPVAAVVPGAGGRVPAAWYTGRILVATGEPVRYVHAGFASVYERCMVLGVSRGVLRSVNVVSGREFERLRFETFTVRGWQGELYSYTEFVPRRPARARPDWFDVLPGTFPNNRPPGRRTGE